MAADGRDRRIAELEEQLREAQATIAALEAQIVQLQQRMAEWERAGRRSNNHWKRKESYETT